MLSLKRVRIQTTYTRTPSFSFASPAAIKSLFTVSKSPRLSPLPKSSTKHLATNDLIGLPGGDGNGEEDSAIERSVGSSADI